MPGPTLGTSLCQEKATCWAGTREQRPDAAGGRRRQGPGAEPLRAPWGSASPAGTQSRAPLTCEPEQPSPLMPRTGT